MKLTNYHSWKTSLAMAIPALLSSFTSLVFASVPSGQMVFMNNCSVCHAVNKEINGPALASVTKKHPADWLKKFIRNSQEVIESGDPYASNLFEQYNHTVMPPFGRLSDVEIDSLLSYLDAVSLTGAVVDNGDEYEIQDVKALRGKILFANVCSMCHALDREVYGPALASVSKRHPYPWLFAFITNSRKVIASGDVYANELYNRYDKKNMPSFEHLKKEELDELLFYIKYASESPSHIEGVNGREWQGEVKYIENTSLQVHKKPVAKEVSYLTGKEEIFRYVTIALVVLSLLACVILLTRVYKTLTN